MDLNAILKNFAAAGSVAPLERVAVIKPDNGPAKPPPASYEI